MLAQLPFRVWSAFTVKQGPDLGNHLPTVGVHVRIGASTGAGEVAHDDTSSAV
ncbi:hypothetical protein I552_9252 [Mycobacterium xenopi 3993]|nr:hypothetical protein I552_9252 [Mycobacterium xenopi 3993]